MRISNRFLRSRVSDIEVFLSMMSGPVSETGHVRILEGLTQKCTRRFLNFSFVSRVIISGLPCGALRFRWMDQEMPMKCLLACTVSL